MGQVTNRRRNHIKLEGVGGGGHEESGKDGVGCPLPVVTEWRDATAVRRA